MARSRTLAALATLVAGMASITSLAACLPPSGTAGASDGATQPGGTAIVGTPGGSPGASGGPGSATQSDTEWGRVWDALPPSFPMPDGANPATDTGEGATSAQLAVPRSVEDVAGFYVAGLGAAGWTVDRDGPLEDGSIDVTATKGNGCQLAISVLPFSEGSLVKVLYGAGCPFE